MKRKRNLLKSRAILLGIAVVLALGFAFSDVHLWGCPASGTKRGKNFLSSQGDKPDFQVNVSQCLENIKDAAGMYFVPALYKELSKDDLYVESDIKK